MRAIWSVDRRFSNNSLICLRCSVVSAKYYLLSRMFSAGIGVAAARSTSTDKNRVALAPEMISQPSFESLGFGSSFDWVVSPIEPSFQPEAQPLTLPLTPLPEVAGRLVAGSVLSKSRLRGQSGLTDVHVRVFQIEPRASIIRNLNHIEAVHGMNSRCQSLNRHFADN